jgi:hypothetical protein
MKSLALFLCLASPLLAQDSLKSSLTFHASFDASMNADFSTGDNKLTGGVASLKRSEWS